MQTTVLKLRDAGVDAAAYEAGKVLAKGGSEGYDEGSLEVLGRLVG